MGGTEVYLRSLVDAMSALDERHEIIVFTNEETGPIGEFPQVAPLKARNRIARILYEQTALPAKLREAKLDVLLNPGFTAPISPPCPQVTVFHDLQHKRHPEYFRWFDLPAWRLLLWAAARRSDRLIAVSPATGADLRTYYQFLDPSRIDIVPHGVASEFFELAGLRDPKDFILCPSTTHPHKNHARLLRSFARLKQRRPELKLILTGVKGFVHDEVAEAAAALGDAVEVRGWMERSELLNLFRTARAIVYPSTFEGFGMPVAEALAARVPLACSDIEPLRTLASGAALLFNPQDEEAMAEAMDRAASGEWSAPEGSAFSLTWEHAARLTIESLRRAVSG